MINKLRVVWICSFSNSEFRNHIKLRKPLLIEKILYGLIGRKMEIGKDSAIWNSNAIEEFEKLDNIELHILSAVRDLKDKQCEFEIRGVYYHVFREENSSLIHKIKRQLFTKNNATFPRNRKNFIRLVEKIKPDIIHVIGAENPYYSLSVLDMPKEIPVIIQLQALLARLVNITDKPSERVSFAYKGKLEKQIIKRADYVGTSVKEFIDYIRSDVKKDAIILKTSLAMGQKINMSDTTKEYDFVYWAANISKAGEDAIEAFILAYKQNPNITLNIIGGYSQLLKDKLMARLESVGAQKSVVFEGLLPTHDDVIMQLRKSKIALLPLKMDFVPNTVHEAMANGLPVVTTITEGTPKLNSNRNTVLLSEQGDYVSMAENMLKILSNEIFFNELRKNGAITEKEYGGNNERMRKWVQAYEACIDNFYNHIAIPEELLAE